MDLKQSSIVIVGKLNPAIIEPMWLIENEVVGMPPEGAPIPMMQLPGRVEFDVEGFHWAVDRVRLTIQSDTERSPEGLVNRLFQELRHTPVQAIGHNFHFRSGVADWKGGRPTLSDCPDFRPEGGGEQVRSRWLGAWRVGAGTLQVDVEVTDEAALLNVNIERRVARADEIAGHASQFKADLASARRVAWRLGGGIG